MKLIPKDAVLAVIDKFKHEGNIPYDRGLFELVCDIESDINSLKGKEVDLEKAIDDYIYTHDGRKRLALELDWKYCNLTLKGGDEIIKFAKHFFELGVIASNPLTLKRFKAQKGESHE